MENISITQTIKKDRIRLRISNRINNQWTSLKDIIITEDGEIKVYDINKGIKS